MIQVTLPIHLRLLAHVTGPIKMQVEEPVTLLALLDAIESQYPMLRGTIRDAVTKERRPFIRFVACGKDISHEPTEAVLPTEVVSGRQPLRIIGAMAGG
jgi:sulfur-carrier protein